MLINRYDTCRASHAQSFALPQILSAVQAHENFRQVAMLSCTEAGRCPDVHYEAAVEVGAVPTFFRRIQVLCDALHSSLVR